MTTREIIKDFVITMWWAIKQIFENPEDKYGSWFLDEVKQARKTFIYWFVTFILPFEDLYYLLKTKGEENINEEDIIKDEKKRRIEDDNCLDSN